MKFKQKSIIETARNIRYNVEISTPEPDNASSKRPGCLRISRSRNNKKHNRITAHHPALPASPAEFCSSSKIHGKSVARQIPFSMLVCTPNSDAKKPQPIASLGVSSKNNISRMGPNIITRFSLSARDNTMSSVTSPIASMPCLRD